MRGPPERAARLLFATPFAFARGTPHHPPMTRLPPLPDLQWTEEGAPRSRTVDDVYFSRAGGLEETRAVFHAGCGLPEAWASRRRFTIAELGFGAGLNALATWAAWAPARPPGGVLHYVSIEAAPFAREDAARALAPFAEIAPFAARLLARWPVRAWGPQRLWFPEDGFALTLIHADVADALVGFEGVVDAWFLDGFAPSRNPAMWTQALMARIAQLSAPGARLATYSVAGGVRRALTAAGFAVEKKPGFAGKRERLEAVFSGPGAHAAAAPASVAIVGAGIAGACLAQALQRRGVPVTVLEAGPAPGSAASGNPAALVSPRLDRGPTGVARLHLAGYLACLDLWRTLGAFERTGLRRTARDAGERAALTDLLADSPLPPGHMAADGCDALFPEAGLVQPARALAALLDGVAVRCGADVSAISREDGPWRLRDAAGDLIVEAEAVILASGVHLAAFAQSGWAPIQPSRGQLEWGPGASPDTALEAGAYAAPFAGGVVFGATFDAMESAGPVAEDDASRARNLAALAALAPGVAAALDPARLQSRAAVRATTPDRAPLAGPAPDAAAFDTDAAAVHAGLWLLGGFGSRGFTLAPLLAEDLAARICGEPGVLDAEMRAAVDPARFLARAQRRRRPLTS